MTLLVCANAIAVLLFSSSTLASSPVAVDEIEHAVDFRANGHVMTRGALNSTTVEILSHRLRSLLSEHGRRAFGEEGQKEVRFTFAVHELDPEVLKFIGDEKGGLWHAAGKLAGTQNMCLLMDRGFSKDPGDPETHWHRDDEAISLPAVNPLLRTVHAWIPMRPMDKDSGTLRYLTGTHRRSFGWFENLLASLWGWEFAWWMTAPVVQDDAMQLGDVAWHDGWVVHSAGDNRAFAIRDGYAVSFAYCADEGACSNAVARTSSADATCRIGEKLFDAQWRARHREGENDYVKTAIVEPFSIRAMRFVWRSIFGALGGLAVHYVAVAVYAYFKPSKDHAKTA